MKTHTPASIICTHPLTEPIDGVQVFQVKPVIKLSFDGILLFANSQGIDFLDELAAFVKQPAIKFLINNCPSMLDPHCNIDLCCQLPDMKYYFSVVAFKEARYIGIYGYRMVRKSANGSLVA